MTGAAIPRDSSTIQCSADAESDKRRSTWQIQDRNSHFRLRCACSQSSAFRRQVSAKPTLAFVRDRDITWRRPTARFRTEKSNIKRRSLE